jgi:hypothetical protein
MKFVSHRRRQIAFRAHDARRQIRHVLKHGWSGALILSVAAAAAVAAPAAATATTGAYPGPTRSARSTGTRTAR